MLLQRSSSDQTPSITYQCRESCGGWGDRLRGITSTFMLAILTQRRFYIDMPYPCNLTRFLQPNLYDWRPIILGSNRSQLLIKTTRSSQIASVIYEKISSSNFVDDWSIYDDIYIATNSDYIRAALRNKRIQHVVRLLNFSSDELTQDRVFPLLYEILFRPTNAVLNSVDQLLSNLQSDTFSSKRLICLHIRMGKNPTIIHDERRSYRDTMVEDILHFTETNLTINDQSIVFVTSDSLEVNRYISNRYGSNHTVSIPGPIIHIDRLSPSYTYKEQCDGFQKVISDFYVLGECDALIMSRSGFSEWGSRRRDLSHQFNHLYQYCRGVYQVTGHRWKRPFHVC
ncbi:unnamed protein product [Adineta ricciae]|uniref:L-Fucosyltransferase n=1 Tax=Adineta ricciae TaxID=249248 RepID=A0A813UC29_ADIRI|nr:unnamed protein product [Adineta ricciae]CAF0826898.1 unnamed protein product [Adineta ricciae]